MNQFISLMIKLFEICNRFLYYKNLILILNLKNIKISKNIYEMLKTGDDIFKPLNLVVSQLLL
jgi:hypothetical protein